GLETLAVMIKIRGTGHWPGPTAGKFLRRPERRRPGFESGWRFCSLRRDGWGLKWQGPIAKLRRISVPLPIQLVRRTVTKPYTPTNNAGPTSRLHDHTPCTDIG